MAKRRNSVEWAQWTHDQNQEMLNSMKMEAFASPQPNDSPSQDNSRSMQGGINHDKISKLMSRKNRTPTSSAPHLPTSLPMRHHEEDATSPQRFPVDDSPMRGGAPHEYSHGNEETSYLEAEIAHLKDERGVLLDDQSQLISIIQSDNAKLMEILNEVKLSKQKMVAKIDTLEKERVKLKAFSAEVIENNIESILGSMPLSMLISKRHDHSKEEEPAEELHGKLVELISQIRAHQAEVLQRALSKVELAEKHFISDRMSEVNAIVDELGRVASAHPNNLQAADALISSMPKALLECISERLEEFQNINKSGSDKESTGANLPPTPAGKKKGRSVSIGDAKVESALELIDVVLAGGNSAGNTSAGDSGWLSGSGTDAKSLMTQNNVLKAGMILLRKKNSEMRARIASLSTASRKGRNRSSSHRTDQDQEPSSSPSPDGRTGRTGNGYRERVATGNTTNDDSEEGDSGSGMDQSDTIIDDATPGIGGGVGDINKRENREKLRKDQESKARRMFNSLPPDQQEYIWNILVSRVADVVEGHPLAGSVSLHLKQETILEVALQVREIMASLLVLPMNEINIGRGGSKPSDLPLISLDALYALVTRALSSTPVAMEIQVHANMILAYLYSRFGETGDGLESEASTYSLPVPEYPVSLGVEKASVNNYAQPNMAGVGFGRFTGLREEIQGSEHFNSDDGGSSQASSHSSGGGNEARDSFNYTGPMEYTNNYNNAQTLDNSKRQASFPVSKPNYMNGTSANKAKRFSTTSPSPHRDRMAGVRAQKTSTANTVKEENFKYYAYKRPSVLEHELPVYNKRS